MSDSQNDWRFKTLRHMETVRNFLQVCIGELLQRGMQHDQTKLEPPEADTFEAYTPKLRGAAYGSEEYKTFLKEMAPALKHHYATYRHHPEHHAGGMQDMTLIDLLEMLCDWKASSMRMLDGDIYKSLDMNQQRFGYSDETKRFMKNTLDWLHQQSVFHKAQES